MDSRPTILTVDDDHGLRKTLADTLRAKVHAGRTAAKGKTAANMLGEETPLGITLGPLSQFLSLGNRPWLLFGASSHITWLGELATVV